MMEQDGEENITTENTHKVVAVPPMNYIDIKAMDSLSCSDDNDSTTEVEEQLTCASSITGVSANLSFYSTRSAEADAESTCITVLQQEEQVMSYPPPLSISQWAEPDSDSFAVRGANYVKDKRKIRAGASVMKLMTVDLVEVDKPIMSGMCSMPDERIQRALRREKEVAHTANADTDAGTTSASMLPPFVFAVNIVVPGPPYYHLVMYFKAEESQMDVIMGKVDSPFSRLSHKFFFGDDDNFRDQTFKLIPRIVEGNFLVRKAVGSTPAIMGTKLKQYYSRCPNNRYFELILDVTSSKVAAHVVGLAKGYAKNLIVDMGFVLEGKTVDVLPEKVAACCRLMHVRFENVRKLKNNGQTASTKEDETHHASHKREMSNSSMLSCPLPPKHVRNLTM